MKRWLVFSNSFFWALILFLAPALSLAGDSKSGTSDTLKGKAKEELEAVKKGSQKLGQEVKQSAKEISAQAGKEFNKAGITLKEAGKEIKESVKETVDDIKKTLKK